MLYKQTFMPPKLYLGRNTPNIPGIIYYNYYQMKWLVELWKDS